MINIRRSGHRGHANFGWLDSRHTFSFGNYYDPDHMGFRALRVINEDHVQAGAGFGEHGHRDMEIVSYVLDGKLAHRDSMGNGSILTPGTVQRMTAGSGIQHSEMNGSDEDGVHFLQIWILPEREGLKPGYEERHFSNEDKRGLRLIATGQERDDALKIHQDVDVYASVLDEGEKARLELREGRHAWVQVIRGQVDLNGETLGEGDGASLSREAAAEIAAETDAELIVFDLA